MDVSIIIVFYKDNVCWTVWDFLTCRKWHIETRLNQSHTGRYHWHMVPLPLLCWRIASEWYATLTSGASLVFDQHVAHENRRSLLFHSHLPLPSSLGRLFTGKCHSRLLVCCCWLPHNAALQRFSYGMCHSLLAQECFSSIPLRIWLTGVSYHLIMVIMCRGCNQYQSD